MKPLGKKIIAIATKARKLTEKFAKEHPFIGSKNTLECFCGIGSKIFQLLARKHGFNVIFVQGQYGSKFRTDPGYFNHCWIEYNSRIIDITATQFGIEDKVYIVPLKDSTKYFPMCYTNRMNKGWGDQSWGRYPLQKFIEKATSK